MTKLFLAIVCCATISFAHNSYTGGYSGAPGRSTCASSCHGGTGGTLVVTGFPSTYQPLQVYTITVRHNGGSRIVNFNATTRIGSTTTVAGTFTAGLNSILYTGADGGVYASPHSIDSAIFQWTAPAAGAGTVNFYAAAFQGTTSSANGQSSRVTLSASESITSVPDLPVHVSPSNASVGNLTSLQIVWRSAARASSYRLQVATDTNFATLVVHDSTLTDTTRLVPGLAPLTTYYWRVSASNIIGASGFTVRWSFRTLGVPTTVATLAPPSNASNQPTTIAFRWQRAFDQTLILSHHSVETGDGPESILGYWHEVVTDTVTLAGLVRDTTLTDTTKTVGSLINLTTYFWHVKAKNQIGWGSFSPWWRFTTIIAAPLPPQLVSPANGAIGVSGTPTIVWRRVTGASTYRLQVASDSNFTALVFNDSTLIDSAAQVTPALVNNTRYYWHVNAKNAGGTGTYSQRWNFTTTLTGIREELGSPQEFSLGQNYPNPFNPSTAIRYGLPQSSFVTITVYNVLGQQLVQLVNENQQAGYHDIVFRGDGLASGVYFYRLDVGKYTNVKKFVVLK